MCLSYESSKDLSFCTVRSRLPFPVMCTDTRLYLSIKGINGRELPDRFHREKPHSYPKINYQNTKVFKPTAFTYHMKAEHGDPKDIKCTEHKDCQAKEPKKLHNAFTLSQHINDHKVNAKGKEIKQPCDHSDCRGLTKQPTDTPNALSRTAVSSHHISRIKPRVSVKPHVSSPVPFGQAFFYQAAAVIERVWSQIYQRKTGDISKNPFATVLPDSWALSYTFISSGAEIIKTQYYDTSVAYCNRTSRYLKSVREYRETSLSKPLLPIPRLYFRRSERRVRVPGQRVHPQPCKDFTHIHFGGKNKEQKPECVD